MYPGTTVLSLGRCCGTPVRWGNEFWEDPEEYRESYFRIEEFYCIFRDFRERREERWVRGGEDTGTVPLLNGKGRGEHGREEGKRRKGVTEGLEQTDYRWGRTPDKWVLLEETGSEGRYYDMTQRRSTRTNLGRSHKDSWSDLSLLPESLRWNVPSGQVTIEDLPRWWE